MFDCEIGNYVYVNHARILSWNQPVRIQFLVEENNGCIRWCSNSRLADCITSQLVYPLHHIETYYIVLITTHSSIILLILTKQFQVSSTTY